MASTAETAVEYRAALRPHPAHARGPARSIEARVCRTSAAALDVMYRISGDLEGMRVPVPRPPRIAQALWQHTCCELFLRIQGADHYHEFNFSPSGEWAVHAFERYREGGLLDDGELDPQVRSSRRLGVLEVSARIDLARLCASYAAVPLEAGVSSVVESCDGTLTYWALAHPAARPDFHHPAAFVLRIDAARN